LVVVWRRAHQATILHGVNMQPRTSPIAANASGVAVKRRIRNAGATGTVACNGGLLEKGIAPSSAGLVTDKASLTFGRRAQ
jgi:hypothetical protein